MGWWVSSHRNDVSRCEDRELLATELADERACSDGECAGDMSANSDDGFRGLGDDGAGLLRKAADGLDLCFLPFERVSDQIEDIFTLLSHVWRSSLSCSV